MNSNVKLGLKESSKWNFRPWLGMKDEDMILQFHDLSY